MKKYARWYRDAFSQIYHLHSPCNGSTTLNWNTNKAYIANNLDITGTEDAFYMYETNIPFQLQQLALLLLKLPLLKLQLIS